MKKLLLTFLGWLIFNLQSFAQCAMCRATIESSISDGGGIGTGFNSGILYLMMMPYVLLALVGYFWYKNSKMAQEKRLQLFNALKRAQAS